MMNSLNKFQSQSFIEALKAFFTELEVPLHYINDHPTPPKEYLGELYDEDNLAHKLTQEVYLLGIVDDAAFSGGASNLTSPSAITSLSEDYKGLLVLGIILKETTDNKVTRSKLADITRVFNRRIPQLPITIIFKYENLISFANSERIPYKQQWRDGEKIGKVTMLKDISLEKTHAAHNKILSGLTIDRKKIDSFKTLYNYWQSVFSLQALNNQFYADLQDWFYFAAQNIKLPYKPDYINEKENIKNFLVRLLARTLFCWFVKEKGLIQNELLELTDWKGDKFKLTGDIEDNEFLKKNSYYRGILQNIFFNALNQKEKKSIKDFGWTKYWHSDLNLDWLTRIPYLNGGIFDKLDEDNAKESIEDNVIKIPNFLFYGIEEEIEIKKGKVEHKGLNGILKSYKFTLDENTPFEEDIALDPEMLGLVFENLLAELDPNLEESTLKSIRKQTGSYYTPRKVIFEMVNDSLNLYLSKYISANYPTINNIKSKVNDLVYYTLLTEKDTAFEQAIVEALEKFKVLDPACGSGAFPMGMLHRIVDLLKVVDADNEKWVALKLKNVDKAQRSEFNKVLTTHFDDYGRKLGIIRDSIYGIDIQPLAVQITKLRFFISLLIDQKTAKGITPMPNIETKIICADSLKNIKADLFSKDAIEKLIEARTRYYQPDISQNERQTIAEEIINILDKAFPSFAFQVTGKRIAGQNKELIRQWFTYGTLAAPFFNMDFFYPELTESGGFDCVIGNPPYGGTKISDEVRNALGIESKDPYGAFIARFLNAHNQATPLKNGGVLAYIVSDTFMTIKSHLKLRQHLMQNYVHKMLRAHPDTFRATVNTVIMVAERNTQKEINENHVCLMADLTNISIHDNYDHFVEVLSQTKGINFNMAKESISNEEYAIYYYPQAVIKTNSSLPFFVASPKLFALMDDRDKGINNNIKVIGGKNVLVRKILINVKEVEVVKLGDLEKIAKGMDSHVNYVYRANSNIPIIRTHYEIVKQSTIRNEQEILDLSTEEKLNGVANTDNFIIPFNKGGSSDSSDGWLPNYFVPIEYYIDWSVKAVNKHYHRNKSLYFKTGLTFSFRGEYSPTFRVKNIGPFDANSSFISSDIINNIHLLTILSSKFTRFYFNAFIQHTVASDIDKIKEIPFTITENKTIIKLAENIIRSQNLNPRYDYASHEQIEIDKLVYEAYGFNAEDVQEVENWFARRYPKLSAAQKANLRALGKSDDYLVLYEMK